MKKILPFIILATISGCATKSTFFQPNEGKSAKLRLVSIPGNNNFIAQGNPNKCVSEQTGPTIATLGWKINLMRDVGGGHSLGMPLYNKSVVEKQQTEIYVPAEKEFSFQFSGIGIAGISLATTTVSYSWCRKLVVFHPKENGNYEAVYDFVKTEKGKTCGVTLYEIKQESSGKYTKEESKNYQVIDEYCKK